MTTAQTTGIELDQILHSDAITRATHKVPFVTNVQGDPIVGFIIVGKNSEEYVGADKLNRVTGLQAASKRQKELDTKEAADSELLVNATDEQNIRTATAVTVGWFGFNVEGAPATFDRAKAAAIIQKMPAWRNMILVALNNDANFMKV